MFWDCPEVKNFPSTLKDILETDICCPKLLLLNDDSSYSFSSSQKKLLFSGLTAAKKTLALCWEPPQSLDLSHWLYSFLDIANMALSVARMHEVLSMVEGHF